MSGWQRLKRKLRSLMMTKSKSKKQLDYMAEKLSDPVFTARLELSLWYKNAQKCIGGAEGSTSGMVVPINIMLTHLVVLAEQYSKVSGLSTSAIIEGYKEGMDALLDQGVEYSAVEMDGDDDSEFAEEGIGFELDEEPLVDDEGPGDDDPIN